MFRIDRYPGNRGAALAACAISLLTSAAACSRGPRGQTGGAGGEPPAAAAPAAQAPALPTAPEPNQVVADVNGSTILARKVYQVYASNKLQYQAQPNLLDPLLVHNL